MSDTRSDATNLSLRAIANTVRFERQARGLTQMQLGAAAGVSNKTISRIENGYDYGFLTISRILHALDLRLVFEFVDSPVLPENVERFDIEEEVVGRAWGEEPSAIELASQYDTPYPARG